MKNFAYFLPGCHENELNNKWWGRGFAEWDNLRHFKSLYAGHEPALFPKDGFYGLCAYETLKRQAEKIKAAGIDGISTYDYWSAGTRPLGRFMDFLLTEPSIDLELDICWANRA